MSKITLKSLSKEIEDIKAKNNRNINELFSKVDGLTATVHNLRGCDPKTLEKIWKELKNLDEDIQDLFNGDVKADQPESLDRIGMIHPFLRMHMKPKTQRPRQIRELNKLKCEIEHALESNGDTNIDFEKVREFIRTRRQATSALHMICDHLKIDFNGLNALQMQDKIIGKIWELEKK